MPLFGPRLQWRRDSFLVASVFLHEALGISKLRDHVPAFTHRSLGNGDAGMWPAGTDERKRTPGREDSNWSIAA